MRSSPWFLRTDAPKQKTLGSRGSATLPTSFLRLEWLRGQFFVFNGELSLPPIQRERRHGHAYAFTHQLRLHLDLAHRREVLLQPLHQLITEFLVAHFATAKLQLKFNLVAFVQKLLSVPHFDHVIVRIDVNPKLDLFKLGRGRLAVFLLFGKVVSVLSEIDDLANGRIGGRSHLNQVEPERLSSSQGILELHYAQLFVGCA